MSKISGFVWKYGDNINTDVLFPGKYTYTVVNPDEMARIAMEDLDPEFAKGVQPGDIVVAGRNFGCGSSREQAALCMKYAGVGAIVAKSFSRLYFRNCINAGLPVITLQETTDVMVRGERVEIDLDKGILVCNKGIFHFPPLPDTIIGIFRDGGLIPHTKKIIARGKVTDP